MLAWTTPIVDPKEVMDEQRYSEDELPTIRSFILSAQSYLYNADAFHPENPLTILAVKLIVGHWLENRDSMGYEYKSTRDLPIGITSIVNSLSHYVIRGDDNA